MLIPLIDTLRCPRAHEETWLVASIDRAEHRDMLEGTLGCPQCMTEYAVHDGIVLFDDDLPATPYQPPDEAEATRISATLDLTEPRMIAVLHGAWGAHAPLVRAMTSAPLLLLNPPDGIPSGDGVSILRCRRVPVARASMDGVAVDRAASAEMLEGLRTALRGGGRMLAAANLAIPAGLTELAHDAESWVARLDPGEVTSAPIIPTRRPRTGSR